MSSAFQHAIQLPTFHVTFTELSFNEYPFPLAWWGMVLLSGYVFYRITWGPPYKGSIPAIGGSDLLSSYWSARNFASQGINMLQTGYEKYKGGIFRVPQLDQWNIIVSGRKNIHELARVPNDVLCIEAATDETLFMTYLIGPTILTNPYHVDLIREKLTRNLANLFDAVDEEIKLALEENFPGTDEWKPFSVHPAITQIVARASSRIFVGRSLCRNPDYLNLSIRFTIDVGNSFDLLARVPSFLRGIVARIVSSAPRTARLTHKFLKPLIEERQKRMDEYGRDYPDKPDDGLSWLMDVAEGQERSSLKLTERILLFNFAGIHTTSLTFTHALYQLAAEPKYLAPLREEVESVVREHGWSKASTTQMHKVDSFLKESQRVNGLRGISLVRKALKDYIFSDGTLVPKGALVAAASHHTHLDDDIYPNASTFDGFRFSDIRQKPGYEITNRFGATNPDYISFGDAKHACPGRFFVANALKIMFAHIILNYDVKMENEGVRPANIWSGYVCMPDSSARVMFRHRQT